MANDVDVVIAGGGPTGMMLAIELALAQVDAVIVEQRVDQEVDGSRAGGLHARTLELLDQRGIIDRFLAVGTPAQVHSFAGVPLDIGDFPTRYPYGLGLWQSDTERILRARVDELGIPAQRSCRVVGFAQDDTGVTVELSDGRTLRSAWLVGCDGGRSVVRKAAGIEFAGVAATASWLLAEVEMGVKPEFGIRRGSGGIGPASAAPRVRVVVKEAGAAHAGPPTLSELSAALIRGEGTDYGVQRPTWISRFTDMTRQAVSYRQGRVFVAGDAAHVHPPHGGQGLNTGVADAVNLGWKLGLVVSGSASDELLDTYHAERHPVGARVLRNARALVALEGTDDNTVAARETVAELLEIDEARKVIAGSLSGLATRYDLGGGHPLVGRRMPDIVVVDPDGGERSFSTLLHAARPVLIDFGGPGACDIGPWADRVDVVVTAATGPIEVPVVGPVPTPRAVLIRPDGHVAWVGEPTDATLPEALARWVGRRRDTAVGCPPASFSPSEGQCWPG